MFCSIPVKHKDICVSHWVYMECTHKGLSPFWFKVPQFPMDHRFEYGGADMCEVSDKLVSWLEEQSHSAFQAIFLGTDLDVMVSMWKS